MGLRFRKSFKLGPVRLNLSKSGVGYSVGGKGLRFTKKAGGGTRTTASIPGTGVSYVTDTSSSKKNSAASGNSSKPKKAKWGLWAAVLACFMLLGACNDDSSAAETPTDPTETSIIETTILPTETGPKPTEIVVQESTKASDMPIEAPTDVPTEPPTEAPTEPPTVPPTSEQTEPEEETHTYVLNVKTKKFHYEWCNSVDDMKESNKKTLETTREDVISRGYEPCGRCKP